MTAPGEPFDVSGGLPPLSELLAWSTSHLTDGAAQMEATADRWENLYTDMWTDIRGVGWRGVAADAAKTRVTSDRSRVCAGSDSLRTAAQVARSGASDVLSSQNRLRYAIQDAQEAGFSVYEDGSVEDTEIGGGIARQAEADEHATRIYGRAKEFVGVDAQVGRRLTDTVNDVETDLNFEQPDSSDAQLVGNDFPLSPGGGQPLSEARRRAVEYADTWAGNADDANRHNPAYGYFGDGGGDCTNFASQVMRAGGFKDVGNGIDDWHRGDIDDWYYNNGLHFPKNDRSNTWSVAQDNYDFLTQHSGRGDLAGIAPMPSRTALDPLAPSKAGLQPGDMIYYRDANGVINHTAVYVGQQLQHGQLVDIVDQHGWGDNNFHNDWMPDHDGFWGGSAEFVHLHYPGE